MRKQVSIRFRVKADSEFCDYIHDLRDNYKLATTIKKLLLYYYNFSNQVTSDLETKLLDVSDNGLTGRLTGSKREVIQLQLYLDPVQGYYKDFVLDLINSKMLSTYAENLLNLYYHDVDFREQVDTASLDLDIGISESHKALLVNMKQTIG